MSQTILERSQAEFNKIRNDEVVKGINAARDLDDEYAKQVMRERQERSRVTIQLDPVDPVLLKNEIKGDIENAIRPEAAKAPQGKIGRDFTMSDMQQYVNNRGKQIERVSEEKQENHILVEELNNTTIPVQRQDSYVVKNDSRIQEDENELG